MRRRTHVLVAFALVALLASSLPALGAPSPMQIAKRALKASKKSDKRSKRALKLARKKGSQGKRGPSGLEGARGVAAPPGANGITGVAGSNGAQGATGQVGSTGATGTTGATGAQGTARAYAAVSDDTDNYIAQRTSGFTGSVSRPITGVYCLTIDPALGISPPNVAAVATPEFANSSDHGGSADVRGTGASCTAGEFAIHTFDSLGAVSDEVSFHLIVP